MIHGAVVFGAAHRLRRLLTMNTPPHRFAPFFPPARALPSTAAFAGGTGALLDPLGPIASAERQMDFQNLGMMWVIPAILATPGLASWFRASAERARDRSESEESEESEESNALEL